MGPELFNEKSRSVGFGLSVGHIVLPGDGKNLVPACLPQPFLIDEEESIVAVERFSGKTDGRRFWVLHEFQSAGMCGNEGFDGPRMRLRRICCHDRFLKCKEILTSTDNKAVPCCPGG
jgi:hypothetical protein